MKVLPVAIAFTVLLFYGVDCAPSLRVMPENLPPPNLLTLPSNATSIRTDITDTFSCDGRGYGFYADVDNGCQLFHVCLPVSYGDGRSQMFRWSFICPEETVFNQEIFTCTRADESIDCAESPRFYDLNRNFGSEEVINSESSTNNEIDLASPVLEDVPQAIGRAFTKRTRKI